MERYEEQAVINAIATRQGTARELAEKFNTTTEALRLFATEHKERIEQAKRRLEGGEEEEATPDTLTPTQLDDLWITNKFERLKRLQAVAEETENMIVGGGMSAAELSMAVREFRSYLMLAANELGQLLHRGSGDSGAGDTLSVEIAGVDMDALR
jgi:hypothetical protein